MQHRPAFAQQPQASMITQIGALNRQVEIQQQMRQPAHPAAARTHEVHRSFRRRSRQPLLHLFAR